MLLNTVYYDKDNEALFRVIYLSLEHIWVINITKNHCWPEFLKLYKYKNNINFGIFINKEDPFIADNRELTESDIKIRDEAYTAISLFLDGTEKAFLKQERNALIKEATLLSGRTRIYIVRQLQRYWQRGLSKNALLPDYKKSGAKGVARRANQNKNGRKRFYTEGDGVFITNEIAALFEEVITKYHKNEKLSIVQTYEDHLIGLYCSRFPKADDTQIPTFRQFDYYFKKHYSKSTNVEKRTPSKVFDKDNRPLISTSTAMNTGPGDRYEIDATIGDIYLVSERDPEKIIGRPTIYYVRDVFSRMITGLYVGLENASWVAAMMAMHNAFTDKVSYCAEYDIKITSEEWPCIGTPNSIMADKGELLSHQSDVLANVFDIDISNSRSYRADDKGGVENLFKTTQAVFKPYADGVVEPINGVKRLGRDYRLDATMTLHQFTKLIITIVLQKNHHNVIKGYDFAPDMPAELVANPFDLWEWGVSHRSPRMRPYNEKIGWINLLPSGKATVSEKGILFKKMLYTCSEAMKRGWFHRIKQTRTKSVNIAFDPRTTNRIYLKPNDDDYNLYWQCQLHDKSRRTGNMSFAEAGEILKVQTTSEMKRRQKNTYLAPELFNKRNDIIVESKANKPNKTDKTKSELVAGIRENKKEAKNDERSKLHNSEEHKHSENHNVHSILQNQKEDNSEPSLDDIMDKLDDQ